MRYVIILLLITSCASQQTPAMHTANAQAVITSMKKILTNDTFKDEWGPYYFTVVDTMQVYNKKGRVLTTLPKNGYLIAPSGMKRLLYFDKQKNALTLQVTILDEISRSQMEASLLMQAKLEKEKKDKRVFQTLTWCGIGVSVALLAGMITMGAVK